MHGIDQIRDDSSQSLARDDFSIGGFSRRGHDVSNPRILKDERRSYRWPFEHLRPAVRCCGVEVHVIEQHVASGDSSINLLLGFKCGMLDDARDSARLRYVYRVAATFDFGHFGAGALVH